MGKERNAVYSSVLRHLQREIYRHSHSKVVIGPFETLSHESLCMLAMEIY